jgi:hypothetical protein
MFTVTTVKEWRWVILPLDDQIIRSKLDTNDHGIVAVILFLTVRILLNREETASLVRSLAMLITSECELNHQQDEVVVVAEALT